jgi:Flp pilus assembly protein CpaB
VLFSRRAKLPNGKAIFGGFLVAAAAAVTFVTALGGHGHTGSAYAVAVRALAPGEIIAPGDTTLAPIRLPAGSSGDAFASPPALVGRTLVSRVAPGELIQASMLAPVGSNPALRPVSVAVDPVSASGLAPGDSVDVLAVPDGGSTPGTAGDAVSVVVRGASLIALGSPGGSSVGSTSTTVATLGVSGLPEIEAIVGASHSGVVSLVRAEPSDGVGAGAA